MRRLILATLLALCIPHSASAAKQCARLHPNLIEALEQARQYGRVAITSICHGRHAARSYHYKTRDGVSLAVDFRVRGNYRAVARHFKGYPGGFAHYGGGSQ